MRPFTKRCNCTLLLVAVVCRSLGTMGRRQRQRPRNQPALVHLWQPQYSPNTPSLHPFRSPRPSTPPPLPPPLPPSSHSPPSPPAPPSSLSPPHRTLPSPPPPYTPHSPYTLSLPPRHPPPSSPPQRNPTKLDPPSIPVPLTQCKVDVAYPKRCMVAASRATVQRIGQHSGEGP